MSLFAELKRRNVFRVAIAYMVVAWLLMQVGDTLAPALLLPEWTLRFLAFVLILGFPLALFFAWAFELTPDGIKLEKSVSREDSVARSTGRKLDRVIIALLAVAVGYFAWDKFADRDSAEAPDAPEVSALLPSDRRSVAVLPFVNMSGDAEQEYFSDGLSEELLNLLAKIPQLRITSRTSAFYFKDKDYTIADVGEQLGVSHVLEGSVRRSGDQIRVTAQLIDVVTDSHLWSETWDREFADVFAIQDEIAESVTSALRIQLVDELPHAYVTDSHAYDLYLRARQLLSTQTEARAVEAEALLLELLEIDPDYAPGLVLLGELEVFLGSWNFRPKAEAFERAESYGHRAVAAAPEFAEAYVVLSRVAVRHKRSLVKSQRYIDQAIRHDPSNVRARHVAGRLEALHGTSVKVVDAAEEMVRLDPLSGQAYWALGHALMQARRYDESAAAFRQLLALVPDATAGHAALAEALYLSGQYEEALREFDAEPFEGFTQYGFAMTYFQLGEHQKSDDALERLLSLDDAEAWAAQIAMVHAVRGENDEAFRWLERGLELNDQGVLGAQVFPFFDNLHDDPRFDDFVEHLWSDGSR